MHNFGEGEEGSKVSVERLGYNISHEMFANVTAAVKY